MKTFVATVVLQLAAEGRLDLDDSLEEQVPKMVDAGAQITLRQLLNHTSGVPDFVFELVAVDLHREWTPCELVTLSNRAPHGESERWAYSNTNYVLLGLLIEAVTRTPLERELERRIVQPLGLESTSARRSAAPTARGYLAPSNPFVPSSGSQLVDASGIGLSWAWPAPRCACAINKSVRRFGLDLRAGLHTGECEVVDGKIAGIAVNIGARVAAQAAPGEVLVSQTVKDLVAGSGLTFEDRGGAELKGVTGEWRLYAVAEAAA